MNLFNTVFKHILFFSTLIPAVVLANNSPSLSNNGQYSLGLDFGIAKPTNIGQPTTFPLGYSTFSYSSNTENSHALVPGVFINKVFSISSLYTVQVGLSAHYLSNMDAQGNLTQGISPPYYPSTYSYNINSNLYLIDAKLRHQFNRCFPYIYLGMGMASNRAYNYSTTIQDYLVVTPTYSNKTTNSFAYSIGFGIDYFVTPKLSLGIGYRFINLGNIGLGAGIVRNINVGAKLNQSNLYVNTWLTQLNYFL